MLAQQSQVEVVGQATGDDDIDSLLEVYLPPCVGVGLGLESGWIVGESFPINRSCSACIGPVGR